MVRTAVARRRIAMAGQDNLDSHGFGTHHGSVEIIDLKPQKDAVSVRLEIRVPDRAVMVLDLPFVQLEDQFPL